MKSHRIDLTARLPQVSAEELLAGFVPTARFGRASFENYRPNPEFPSQAAAVSELRRFVTEVAQPKRASWNPFVRRKNEGAGRYLDGGFGVGKTHLLAASWHEFDGRKAFLSFQELLYTIGVLGRVRAAEAFGGYRLLAIDEFELDDPGNTHMASTFLGELMPAGTHVITTSNTEPGQLGQGRFNASDFERQIMGIAARFEMLPVDGPDYRQRGAQLMPPLSGAQLDALEDHLASGGVGYARLSWAELERHLLRVHPARFTKLLEGVGAVLLDGLAPIENQNSALRLVHFVDKVYDLNLRFAASGSSLDVLFSPTYRSGAYAKKYSRCLSRLSELLSEAGEILELR
ncbi:cell division protein ZapE [Deinobacterium chartae]|uniref:Cell division protein ZapE n=1 Tax=Deinobacterium chartae TaxID=521158 RepID=A0A841HY63_9DEIO|nr:AFG1/ZapE family ATPase [Deinobacterium chartae]MBB6097823.1 cell division protein ZapE [Deinobacterium chartae]